MRKNSKCTAFCFTLSCHLIFLYALLLHDITVMKQRMCGLMHRCFHRLQFCHARLQNNFLVGVIIVTLRPALDLIKADRHRGNTPDRFHENLIILHACSQLFHTQLRKRVAVCLRQIKNRRYSEPRNCDRDFFRLRLSVIPQNNYSGVGIGFLLFLLLTDRGRGNDLYTLFAFHHMPVEFGLPGAVTSDQSRIRTL